MVAILAVFIKRTPVTVKTVLKPPNGFPNFSIKKWFPKFLNQKMVSQISQSKNGFPYVSPPIKSSYWFHWIFYYDYYKGSLISSSDYEYRYMIKINNYLDKIMSIGITACSIIMDISLVIKTAERHLIYFIATKLMFITSDCFHFVAHLFFI